MLAPPDGTCTRLPSHSTLYCCSPSLIGDSTNAATVGEKNHARVSHLLPPAGSSRARFRPFFCSPQPPQRFSQRQSSVLRVFLSCRDASRLTIFCSLVWSLYASPLSGVSHLPRCLSPAATWAADIVHLHTLVVQSRPFIRHKSRVRHSTAFKRWYTVWLPMDFSVGYQRHSHAATAIPDPNAWHAGLLTLHETSNFA